MSQLITVRVDGMSCQGDRSLAIRLVATGAQRLPDWQPGAHIDLHLPGGQIRQYSLTGSPDAQHYLICVSAESASRGGSRYVHQTLRPGQTLSMSAPRNLFSLHKAEHTLLLAAGIGITPIYAMALTLERAGHAYALHYFVKRRAQAAFLSEMQATLNQGIHLHCSDADDSPRQRLPAMLNRANAHHQIYLCGPAGFMSAAKATALSGGWAEQQIHSEAFQPAAETTGCADDAEFMVTLASSGSSWPIPADKTIARVLLDNGIDVPLSCEMGLCGACLTPVLEGIVDHRDTVQSDSEKAASAQQIALCCSRSRSAALVIDL